MSLLDALVIGDLTFDGLHRDPFALVQAWRAADSPTRTAFLRQVRAWGGEEQPVADLLDALVELAELHAAGGEATDELLNRLSAVIAEAELPTEPWIIRVAGGYLQATRRDVYDPELHEGYRALWWLVLAPLVEVVLREAERIGACERCGKLFVRSKLAAQRKFCSDSCRKRAHEETGRTS